jgi:hypothetical protein
VEVCTKCREIAEGGGQREYGIKGRGEKALKRGNIQQRPKKRQSSRNALIHATSTAKLSGWGDRGETEKEQRKKPEKDNFHGRPRGATSME